MLPGKPEVVSTIPVAKMMIIIMIIQKIKYDKGDLTLSLLSKSKKNNYFIIFKHSEKFANEGGTFKILI